MTGDRDASQVGASQVARRLAESAGSRLWTIVYRIEQTFILEWSVKDEVALKNGPEGAQTERAPSEGEAHPCEQLHLPPHGRVG